jgi:hypothetical protein
MKNLNSTLLLTLLVVLGLSSCRNADEKGKLVLPGANGRVNDALIVIDNDLWAGEVGDIFKDEILDPVVGLPQEEPQLDVSQIPSQLFGTMMRSNRSIIRFELGTAEQEMIVRENVWADPQIVITFTAANKERLKELVEENGREAILRIKRHDLEVLQRNNRRDRYRGDLKTLDSLGVSLVIPNSFAKDQIVDTGDFLWMTQRLSGGIAQGDGQMSLLVYSYPIDEFNAYKPSTVIRKRDEIGQLYIPGPEEGQYMITEKLRQPVFYKTDINGFDVIETHSTWELKDAWMAGPFINYAFADWENARVIAVEGFVYAPSVDKRDYMMDLEAIIKTFKLKS